MEVCLRGKCNELKGAVEVISPWDFFWWPQIGRTIIFGFGICRQSMIFIY
jgi:hypothetical protein